MKVLRVAHHAVVDGWRQRERELRALGVDVELVSSRRWNEGGARIPLEPGSDGFVRGAATLGRHPSVFVYDPRPIWRALGGEPDVIDLHEEPNALATAEVLLLRRLRRSSAPYLLYSAQNLDKRYPIPFRWLEAGALRGAAAVYVCNREAGEIVVRKGLRGKAAYLPLGVDLGTFAPRADAAPGERPLIGYVGRLEAHKGVDVLLGAVARRPEWRLRVLGDGPRRAELEALAVSFGVAERVEFLGHVAGEALAAQYRELDVVAVPSLDWPGWREQFCRVAVEAMASGVPVVGSRSGAIPDVLGDAGITVEPGSVDALELGLLAAVEPATWSALRSRGIARAAEFSWPRVAAGHLALYEEAIGPVADSPVDAGEAERPVEVLIVAYGSAEPLVGCLEALEGGGLPVTVVDNSSSPETRQLAADHGARYVDAGSNLGFAAGVNLGLSALAAAGAAGADVLLLNPDARIDPASVRLMHARLRADPRLAAVGAAQTEPDSGAQLRVWWPFPTPWGAWLEALGLGSLRRARDFAIGSVLLLRAEALRDLGGLDERFFLYAEETDWQYRARKQGWSIAVVQVEATHEGAGTGGDVRRREAHFYGSAERYIRKHYGGVGWQLYRAANVAGAGVRAAILPEGRRQAARRRLGLFVAGPMRIEEAWR